MRSFALCSGLVAWALAWSARATLDNNQGTRLSPIKLSDWEAATGIHRRASDDFSHLQPIDQARLIFGRPGKNGKLLLADMNLYASNGLNIVMMEKFEGLTKSVDCKGDDGTMSLTFKSESAFNYALKTWNFINEAKEKRFLLIANHDGCGPDDERQPYIINKIREDKNTLTTFLEAQIAPWSEVADTYDLAFGHVFRKPATTPRLKHRGLFGDIVNGVQGNFDFTKSASFSVAVGQSGQRTNIYTAENGHIKLDCIDCFVSGSFLITGHLVVKHFKLQDLTLDASPQSVLAKLELEATLTASDTPEALTFTKELFAFGIPDAGIAVTGIFSLGATLKYDVGVSSTFKGQGVFDFGLQAGLPDTAKLTADVSSPGDSSATGFDGFTVTPIFDVKSLSASVTVAAFSQPKLSLGIDITKIGHLDVAINVELPKVSATLTAEFAPEGVCSPGSSKTGIKLDSEVDVEVDLALEAGFGESNKVPFNKKLFGITKPLFSTCFPLDIPGLSGPSSSAVVVPSSVISSVLASSVLPSPVIPTASIPVVTPITTPTILTTANLSSPPFPTGSVPFPTGGVNTRPLPSGGPTQPGSIPSPSGGAQSGRPVASGNPVPSVGLRFRRSPSNPRYAIRV